MKISYSKDFNDELKDRILERDGYKCIYCGRTNKEELDISYKSLSIHHVNHNKKNINEKELATLCGGCNVMERVSPEINETVISYLKAHYQ